MTTLTGMGVVVRKKGSFEVERLSFLPPQAGEVRVAVKSCGLCQSDVAGVSGKIAIKLPTVLGHEGAGVVESVGPGVTKWKVGDAVVLVFISFCGKCEYCISGRSALCEENTNNMRMRARGTEYDRVLDMSGNPISAFSGLGCMAEYTICKEDALVAISDDTPMHAAALVGCGVTTGVGAVLNRAHVHVGSTCVVYGCGGVGLNAIQACRISGAKQIIAVDTLSQKLNAAKKFGATHTFNAKDVENVPRAVRKLTGGGVDYGFEVIGYPETYRATYDCVKKGGMCCLVGVAAGRTEVKIPTSIVFEEKTLTGSFYGSCRPSLDMPTYIEMYLKGDLLLDELVSKYYTIDDAYSAFNDLASGTNLRGVFMMHDLVNKVSSQGNSGANL